MTEHLTGVVIDARHAGANRDARRLAGIGRRVTARLRKGPAMPSSRALHRLVRTLGLLVPFVLVAGALTGCDLTPGGTASVTSEPFKSTLHFDPVRGRNNSITVSLGTQGSLLLRDSGNTVTPGPGCAQVNVNTVRCSFDATMSLGFTDQIIRLGDGNDTFASSVALPTTVHAGSGDDTVSSGPSSDVFFEDSDAFDRDSFSGGAGIDGVRYAGVMHAVNISLNDVADDGRPGEGDNVKSDIENISGTGNADTLTGDGDNNAIFPLDPNDVGVNLDQLTGGVVIHGGGGNDTIWGTNWGNADDRLSGGTGNDTIDGFAGNDTLSGKAGDDSLSGGAGFDALDGGTETDYCNLGPDGGTTVNCESGP